MCESKTANFCSCLSWHEGWNIYLLAGGRRAFKPSKRPQELLTYNYKCKYWKTRRGGKLLWLNQEITVKPPQNPPKTATVGRFLGSVLWGFHMLLRLTHLRGPRDFINWALLAFNSSYYTFAWRQALVLSMHRLIKRFISPLFLPLSSACPVLTGPPLTNSWQNGNMILFEHRQAH